MVRVNCTLSEAFTLCHYPGLTRFLVLLLSKLIKDELCL